VNRPPFSVHFPSALFGVFYVQMDLDFVEVQQSVQGAIWAACRHQYEGSEGRGIAEQIPLIERIAFNLLGFGYSADPNKHGMFGPQHSNQ
jgi:hypothetical protein